MSVQEQEQVREEFYNKALRYMHNSEEIHLKAGREGKYYLDKRSKKTKEQEVNRVLQK